MSINANVESRSSGTLRTSATRVRVKTVEPAPMNAILGISLLSSSQPTRKPAVHPLRMTTASRSKETIGPTMSLDHEPAPPDMHDLPRAQRILTLEFGSRKDFANPS